MRLIHTTPLPGFYRTVRANQLLAIGPYQGGHGCLFIPYSKGVCGAAARTATTQLVPNVHDFPGHIACASSYVPSALCNPCIVGMVGSGSGWEWQLHVMIAQRARHAHYLTHATPHTPHPQYHPPPNTTHPLTQHTVGNSGAHHQPQHRGCGGSAGR